jgi:hypothetical protein
MISVDAMRESHELLERVGTGGVPSQQFDRLGLIAMHCMRWAGRPLASGPV